MITQCPNCKASFKLPLEQISSSRGEVCCGECSKQFNALNHLLIEDGATKEVVTLNDVVEHKEKSESIVPPGTQFIPVEEDEIDALLSGATTARGDSIQQPPLTQAHDKKAPLTQSPETDSSTGGKNKSVRTDPAETIYGNYLLKQALEGPSEQNQAHLLSTLTSLTVIIILVATLGLQYLLTQREYFSQHRHIRPILVAVCSQFNCVIPPKHDLSLLTIVNNKVETHPQSPNALLIKAELSNRGDFKQKYPVVELVMTNLQQEVVASRDFYPNEYLPDFSADNQLFVSNSNRHLRLEVVDPGSHATGFEFILHSQIY